MIAVQNDIFQEPGGAKKFRLSDFFNRWWDEYVKHPAEFITPEQYKAANAIRVCRTSVLGIDTYVCPECGDVKEVRHTCKNRFCPSCGWNDTLKWAGRMKDRLLKVPHRHVVMTLPHVLHDLVRRNKRDMLDILMRAAADTLKDWMMRKFGLKTGVIAVLHTYGEQKQLHVHTHMIMSWGGIDSDGKLIVPEHEYVHIPSIRKVFRHKFENALISLFDAGRLSHDFHDRMDFMGFIKKTANKKDWIVHLEPPMQMPEQVIQYVGRYSKRACLSEYKITAMDGEYISFRYRDYKNSPDRRNPVEKELTLHYREFFPRLLQHVPLHYFRIVRYYGFYSNRGNLPEEYFGRDEADTEESELMATEATTYENPYFCDSCGRTRVYCHTTVTSGGKTYTVMLKHCDVHNGKAA